MGLKHFRQQSVLLVEDEEGHAEIIRRSFEAHGSGFAVTVVTTVEEAKEILRTFRFSLVIADWRLPDGSGIDLLNRMALVPLLLMTSFGNEEVAVEAMKAGALDYVIKSPETLRDMPAIASRALQHWEHLAARFQAEEDLRQSEEKFRSLAEFSSMGIFSCDLDGRSLYANPAWQEITGRPLDASIGIHWAEATFPDDKERILRQWIECARNQAPFQSEFRFLHQDASVRWVQAHAQPIVTGGKIATYVGSIEDITDRRGFETTLTAALREKETLVQEVHHRVKNNLQLISSMLQLQAAEVQHPQVTAALEESQARVYAMALIHENLYQSELLDRVDAGSYLRQLVSGIRNMYAAQPSRVQLCVEAHQVALNMRTAVPLALIANELVTNAVKHAYPAHRQGTIRVELEPLEGPLLQLSVADDGIGLPGGLNVNQSASLGLKLVNRLSEQLEGRLEWTTGSDGTKFTLAFDGG